MLKRRIMTLALLAALVLGLCVPALALDDDELEGYAADTLTVKVGYFGGPYYEKYVFTLDELWAMDVVYGDYTFLDNMPSVVIDHVAGVRLADIVEAAGIDINSVQNFYFWTRDKQSDYYTSYAKTELIDTARYCYYSLPDNFDDEEGTGNDLATSDGVLVDTLIALADDWNRCIQGATFGSDYLNLHTNTRFRLIFGQTNSWERTASRSAKWIHEIVVELGGAPTVTMDASVLEGEVGSLLRTEPSIDADSAVLENEAVTWDSSDTAVAQVDADGNITVVGEGTAVITATFAGVSASVTVTGTPGGEAVAETEPETPDDTAPPEADAPETAPVELPEQTGTTEAASEDPSTEASQTQQEAADESEEPLSEESATESTEDTTLLETETISGHVEVIEPTVQTDTEVGGVQNWRIYEMAETATELGNVETEEPALLWTCLALAGLFVLSGILYGCYFYSNTRGRKHHDR